MPWLQAAYVPLIAIGVGFHFGVTWVLFSRYVQKRDPGVFWWLTGWVLLTGHVLAMLLTHVQGPPPAFALQHLAYLAAAYAFFAGVARATRPGPRLAAAVQAGTGLAAMLAAVGIWWPPAAGVLAGGALPVSLAAAGSFLAAAWLARPRRGTSQDLAGGLLVAGFLFGSLHALDYSLFTAAWWKTPLEILESALFSFVFATAVTLRAWAQARELRVLQRVVEALNRPLGGQETLAAALDVVLDEFRLSQGWAIVREEGRGGVAGRWARTAVRGFPGWASRGLTVDPAFPLRVCRCLQPVTDEAITSAVNVLPCPVTAKWTGRQDAGRHAVVPLGAGGAISGLMVIVLPARRRLAPGELQLLSAIGEPVGLALDRARLYDEAREREAARGLLLSRLLSAQEDERARIARELHDEVGQALTAIIVGLDLTARPTVRDAEVMRNRLRELKEIAEGSLQEIRRVIHDLRPTVLDDLGLAEALQWLVRRYLEPAGLQVELEIQGLTARLPGHTETAIFRFIQEAGTNAIKHAQARRLNIAVCRVGNEVTVTVADDGRGLPPAEARAHGGGTGLAGLRERVTLLDGRLKVHSAPGRGTRLTAVIPVPAAGSPQDRSNGAAAV